MKYTLPILFLLTFSTLAAGQTPTRERRSVNNTDVEEYTLSRDRVIGPRSANHASPSRPAPSPAAATSTAPEQKPEVVWGNTAVIARPTETARPSPKPVQPTAVKTAAVGPEIRDTRKLVQPTALVKDTTRSDTRSPMGPRPVATNSYSVGIGDVLDIRLANMPTKQSTLFTVLKNGTLEYPLLNGPISVTGLTTDEIAQMLANEIHVIRSPRVTVSVRDYASHAVLVTGAVNSPGRKVLRREATPLYVVLAEAMMRPDAMTARIVRNGKESVELLIKSEQAMATLVQSGDSIKVSGLESSNQFLYIGGDVSLPGEKTFRAGLTLTQALLAAGGVSRGQNAAVKISRRNSEGFLTIHEYRLRAIEEGKSPDPLIHPGDRIEVSRM